jgi:ATP-dependent DNA helicase RecG
VVGQADPLRSLVGDRTAKALAQHLGLHTVRDQLRHYPRRYVERGQLTAFGDLQVDEHATVFAEIVSAKGFQLRPKLHKIDVRVTDGTGSLTLTIFNQSWRLRDLVPGRRAFFAGKVERFRGQLQLTNPEVQLVEDEEGALLSDFAGAIIPVYPASAKASSLVVQRSVRMALDSADLGADPLPDELRARRDLIPLREALEFIHRPPSWDDLRNARTRLKYDEALVVQVTLAQRRATARAIPGTAYPRQPDGLLEAFDARLPFELTDGQRVTSEEIFVDLATTIPMQRLIQGEVGSGKTVVALRAMLAVVDGGGQAALLAPTEVLAQQHARTIAALMGPLGDAGRLGGADNATRIALITGSMPATARREALLDVASGAAGIVVGTHALLEEQVQFGWLGLVVVDEQHRFGVEQRDRLRVKAASPPHLLVMTATPIPRTVAMTVYGDLEVSTLRELPVGRSPIATFVVPTQAAKTFARTWEKVAEEVAAGHQAYVVCPRIGEGAEEEPSGDEPIEERRRPGAAVLEAVEKVRELLPDASVDVLHGRMPSDAKDDVMRRFGAGEVDVLVATTVIEVGVDVPNATVMVILDAEWFGVSQLHQLRGRVGRGSAPGLCLLVSSAEEEAPSWQRLQAVAATLDGFELARVDLEQRREGNVLGAEQSGKRSSLRLLSLVRDEEVILSARSDAARIVELDPELEVHPALAAEVSAVIDADSAEFLEKT